MLFPKIGWQSIKKFDELIKSVFNFLINKVIVCFYLIELLNFNVIVRKFRNSFHNHSTCKQIIKMSDSGDDWLANADSDDE